MMLEAKMMATVQWLSNATFFPSAFVFRSLLSCSLFSLFDFFFCFILFSLSLFVLLSLCFSFCQFLVLSLVLSFSVCVCFCVFFSPLNGLSLAFIKQENAPLFVLQRAHWSLFEEK
jgi:hypothetical protein